MKFKLSIQSFFPLYLLLLIFNFNKWNEFTSVGEFWLNNWYVVVMKSTIIILIIMSIIFYFSFNSFKKYGNETHTKVDKVKNINEESLLFFVTFIIPICFSEFTDLHQSICCILTLSLILILLMRTTLYYKNPILTLLKYNLYEIETDGKEIIIITKSTIKEDNYIIKKKISDNIYIAKEK